MKTSKFLLFLPLVFIISCSKSDDDVSLPPSLTTADVSGVANTVAVSGGNITSDNGSAVTARGVVWSTTENPTTANSKTTDGTGTGDFISNLTGLTANTAYYLRAYATNAGGTTYGNQLSFTTTNVPAPGTTVEYIVDAELALGSYIYIPGGSNYRVCYETQHAIINMDPYAIKYTVHFYEVVRHLTNGTSMPSSDLTYTFVANAGVNIIKAGTNDGNYTYETDYYSIGNPGAVTRDTQANKLYCNLSWCTGEGVCNGPCDRYTAKAKITVHY